MKKIFVILIALNFLSLGVLQLSAAQENAGNTICPVTGEKINEKTKATYEYNGKVYNLCCPMCVDIFKKDPEKYAMKAKEEIDHKVPDQAGHHHGH